ncbi:phosphopantetheine-binding protein [Micromonospora sp. NPDC050980]|uniref:phosphopantetheine-binding protein n=1 Tax=Micromonospora sp. NPDC050980 TaxID=3155161 RepID=UPI0033F8569B
MSQKQNGGLTAQEMQQRIAAIWREVLGGADDRPEATFFELNGQSIAAVRIVARIEDELGVQVDMGDLFEDPDLATFTRDVLAKADTLVAGGDRS